MRICSSILSEVQGISERNAMHRRNKHIALMVIGFAVISVAVLVVQACTNTAELGQTKEPSLTEGPVPSFYSGHPDIGGDPAYSSAGRSDETIHTVVNWLSERLSSLDNGMKHEREEATEFRLRTWLRSVRGRDSSRVRFLNGRSKVWCSCGPRLMGRVNLVRCGPCGTGRGMSRR